MVYSTKTTKTKKDFHICVIGASASDLDAIFFGDFNPTLEETDENLSYIFLKKKRPITALSS